MDSQNLNQNSANQAEPQQGQYNAQGQYNEQSQYNVQGQYNAQQQYNMQAQQQYDAYNQPMQYDTANAQGQQYDAYGNPLQQQYNPYSQQISSPIIEESKKGRGFIGALIGAIVGGILWTIIGCFGYISGWIAILIFVLAQFGYKKLAGKMDKFGIVISLILGLLIIIPATYISFGWGYYKVLSDEMNRSVTFWEVLQDLPLYIDYADDWGTLWANLGLGYFFTIVAGVFMLISSLSDKAQKRAIARRQARMQGKDGNLK